MGKDNQFWRFENNATGDTEATEATLYIYGDIVQYEGWNYPDDAVPNKFRKELAALGNMETIHVRINSNGGSVFGAYAIMNLLKANKAQIITYNDGIAASAATIIAMAGDKIVSALGSVWMVHLPSTWAWGNADELQKAIDILGTITESMVDIYHARTGIEKAELLEMLKADTWMTGSQAFEKGFVDEVTDLEVVAYLGEDKQTAFFNGLNISLDKVRNKEVLASMLKTAPPKPASQAQAAQPTPPIPLISNKNEEDTLMNLEDLKAKHPEIYNQAVNEGRQQGITAERERIQAIDDIALAGMEELTNKAKYETGITAADFAMELIKAQKQKGINFLNQAQEDAKELDDVSAAGATQTSTEDEENAMLAHLAEANKNVR